MEVLVVREPKIFCTNYTCLTRTCSRHRCHHPKRYTIESKDYEWDKWGPKDKECDWYKGPERLETLVVIPEDWDVEE